MSEQLAQQQPAALGSSDLGRKSSFGKIAANNGSAIGGVDFTSSAGPFGASGLGITRERSFVRMPSSHHGNHTASSHQQQSNKRRSVAFGHPHQHAVQQQQMRGGGGGKPALELYRPPNFFADGRHQSPLENKLNVHAQEFQMARGDHLQNSRSSMALFQTGSSNGGLQHSKSSNNMQQQQQQQQQQLQLQLAARQLQLANMSKVQQQQQQRASMVLQQQQQQQMQAALAVGSMPSGGNVMQSTPRVKFAPEPHTAHLYQQQQQHQQQHMTASLQHHHLQLQQQQQQQQQLHHHRTGGLGSIAEATPLQRSKSLSSADAIARGIAGLGLGVVADTTEIGTFIPEIQALVDQAREDPNQLNARSLMELANHVMQRAVEGRRYALPTSRFCIAIIAKEHKETFLEALLNTCRQWYQERDKVLGTPQSIIKNVSRPRFTAFMAFLTEMFCQLKRRQLQLRTVCEGVPPPLVLLTLLSKCCEDCVRPPVRSLSEIECLFFVLTCIGRDLEQHLPLQLESLLASVRDAFLNASASAPAIRRTLLQLIELQASRWQLPGNTVLYYYPSTK